MSSVDEDAIPDPGAKTSSRHRYPHKGDKPSDNTDKPTRIDYSSDAFKASVVVSGVQNLQIGSSNQMVIKNSRCGHKKIKKTASKPLCTSLVEVSSEQHNKISENLGTNWRDLGRKLGFTDGELDTLKIDHKDEGQKEVCYQMIRRWKQKTAPNATVAAISIALNDIGRGDIADMMHG